jgi:arabinogalactan endo-1,4-beta-galactosidase
MSKYEALFEDEDNIFGGSPQSKFWDIVNQSSEDVVSEVIDLILERYAIMEQLLEQHYTDEEIDRAFQTKPISEYEKLQNHKKSLYMDFTTEIVQRLDS